MKSTRRQFLQLSLLGGIKLLLYRYASVPVNAMIESDGIEFPLEFPLAFEDASTLKYPAATTLTNFHSLTFLERLFYARSISH